MQSSMLIACTVVVACGASATFTIDDQDFSHVWNTKTAMPTKRSDLTATTVGDAIYLIAGCDSNQEYSSDAGMYICTGITNKVEKYLPATDSFELLTEAPRSRYRHAAGAVGSKIYLFGGCAIDDSIISEVDVFDTVTGSWSTLSEPMPNATSDLSAFVDGGKIYTLGGFNRPDYLASSAMMIFDPSESSKAWSEGPSLMQGRGDAGAIFVGGQALALGGFHHDDWSFPLDHLEMFDPKNPSSGWKVREGMSVARGDFSVAVLHDMIHVVGGETKNQDGDSVALMDVEVYEISKDRWYAGGKIPSHRFRFVAAAHGESLFIFGGQGALSGSYGVAGSKYPVLDTVDEYHETATTMVDAGQMMHALNPSTIVGTFLFIWCFF